VPFTAFTSRRKAEHVTARLIVRRVKRLNPTSASGEVPNELFAGYRYHGVFTDSPLTMLEAEVCHRRHAIIGAGDRRPEGRPAGPHLPSGLFTANDAWLVCAAMAFNLTRAAGVLASTFHAKAVTATGPTRPRPDPPPPPRRARPEPPTVEEPDRPANPAHPNH
jgi:hypothetical protein